MPNGEALALELGAAEGPTLRVEWDLGALRELNAGSPPSGIADARPIWRLEAEPGWETEGALRVISASFDDGALLAVAALRPLGVDGHDAEAVGAVLVAPKGEPAQIHEALLSTEYGPDGEARRLGLELYESSTDPPIRVFADRMAEAREHADGKQTALRLRMEGTPGAGLYELMPAVTTPLTDGTGTRINR